MRWKSVSSIDFASSVRVWVGVSGEHRPTPGPLTIPNGIRIHSAILPQYTFWTDRHTHRHTDRWSTVCNKSVRVPRTLLYRERQTTVYYRVMHYSAKRGLVFACRLSVCLSVTLVDQDHVRWKSSKLIVRTISPTSSLFVAQRSPTYSLQGKMEKFWGGGWEKSGVLEHKSGNIFETR